MNPVFAIVIPLSGPVDPGFGGGIGQQPGYPSQGLPGFPPHAGHPLPPSPGMPGYDLPWVPGHPGAPLPHPPHFPGHDLPPLPPDASNKPIDLPSPPLNGTLPIFPVPPGVTLPIEPGQVYPPLGPSVPVGKALAVIWIQGFGYRWTLVEVK